MKYNRNFRKKNVFAKILLIGIMGICIYSGTIYSYAEETDYEYDELGRVTKVTYEDGSYVEYEYDSNGNIILTNYVMVEDEITDTTSEESNNEEKDSEENSDVITDIEASGDSTGTAEEQQESTLITDEVVENNTNIHEETENSDGHSLNEEYEDTKEKEDNVDGTNMEDSTDTADKESPERKNRGEGKIINKSSVLVISVGVAIGIPFITFIMMLLLKGKRKQETDVKKEGENTDEKKNEYN